MAISMDSRQYRADAQAPVRPTCAPTSLTATSWSPGEELRIARWVEQGRWLGALGRASGWWIGDWIRYGNARYGERYVPAARVTGYDVQSLMNMAYVAGRFEVARRRQGLSFSHHAEVASLSPEDQEIWLDRAEAGALSVRAVRRELREARRRRAARLAPVPVRPRPRHITDGARGGRSAARDQLLALPPTKHAATSPSIAAVWGLPDDGMPRGSQPGRELVCPACGHHFDGQPGT